MVVGVGLGGQEIGGERDGPGIRDGTPCSFSEVRGGLDIYEFCGFDQAVEERSSSCSTLRATAVMILATNGQRSQPALYVVRMCAVKGAFFARVRYPTGKLSLQPENTRGGSGGDKWTEALREKASLGGQCATWAATRSEYRAGPETAVAGVDPPYERGRPLPRAKRATRAARGPAGVMVAARVAEEGRATREAHRGRPPLAW